MTEFLFFTQPLALFLTVLLPLFWLILKLFPLKAKPVVFPALVLFGKDKKDKPKPRDIPPWLKLLRLAVFLFLILGLAQPVYDPDREALSFSPTLIVIDNSWASTVNWQARIETAASRLKAFADVSQVPITIMTTAPDMDTGQIRLEKNMTPGEAQRFLSMITPQPWNSDYDSADSIIKEYLYQEDQNWDVFWLGDGQNGESFKKLYDTLSSYGGTTSLYHDENINQGLIIADAKPNLQGIDLLLKRRSEIRDQTLLVSFISRNGDTLMQEEIIFPKGIFELNNPFSIPEEMLAEIGEVRISDFPNAATIWRFEGGLGRGHAGIISSRDVTQKQDYLNDVFYLHRALSAVAKTSSGPLSDLLNDETISLLVLPDSTKLTDAEYKQLESWIVEGGGLLRFAGPNILADNSPRLLPVKILTGQRSFGGALTWEDPARIKGFSAQSPFANIKGYDKPSIQKQILAQPDIDLTAKTWVFLEDQTPLITADKVGKGQTVFVHTTADPSWSDISISEAFPPMLDAILNAAASKRIRPADDQMVELSMPFDAYGKVVQKENVSKPLEFNALKVGAPSKDYPAGIYQIDGNDTLRFVYNLGDSMAENLSPTGPYYFFDNVASYSQKPYRNLAPWFFVLAAILMFAEMLAGFILIHGAGKLKPQALLIPLILSFTLIAPAHAQNYSEEILATEENRVNFAYVITGDAERDSITAKGLQTLGALIEQRTTVEFGKVNGVVPGTDDLGLYPFLYWQMTPKQSDLTEEAIRALQHYLDHGGLLFFDTRDGQFSSSDTTLGQETMQRLAGDLNFNVLKKLDSDHVLSRSYYLLNSYEGLYKGRPVWVETTSSTDYDGAPSVIVGAHDWAGAWANIDPLTPILDLQNSMRSREMALRFGVNMVMMALTGSYKTDQVHIKYILERMEDNGQ